MNSSYCVNESSSQGMQAKSGCSLTASHLLEYLFCPRFTYFEYVLDIPEHQEQRFKVQTRSEDSWKNQKNESCLSQKKAWGQRKKSDVYLAGKSGIRGIVDEILFFNDGTAAALDYKYAEYKDRTFKNHRFQLVFYAQLIKDNFHIPVNKGFIVYTRSKNKLVEVSIKDKDFIELKKIIANMTNIINNCRYPEPTSVKRRCPDCCYKNICESTI